MSRRRESTETMTILADLRRASGLSQLEIARRLGRSQTLLCRWERGTRSPSIDDALRLAMVMGTERGLLLGLTTERRRRARARRRSIATNIGGTLMALRKQRRLTPEDVFHAVRITPRTLSQLERGRHASLAELQALCAALGADLVDVLTGILDSPDEQ